MTRPIISQISQIKGQVLHLRILKDTDHIYLKCSVQYKDIKVLSDAMAKKETKYKFQKVIRLKSTTFCYKFSLIALILFYIKKSLLDKHYGIRNTKFWKQNECSLNNTNYHPSI